MSTFDYLKPAPERETIGQLIQEAPDIDSALFDLADRYGANVTNNEPRWQDGRYLWEVGEFMSDARAIFADMIAQAERAAAAKAWLEGYDQRGEDINWSRPHSTHRMTDNPYRADRIEAGQ